MDHSSYWELGAPQEGPERTAYFVLDSLLKSRIECGFESNSERYDEEVNVYLVHLLASLVQGATLAQEVASRDIDVFTRVKDSTDPRHKSAVYRSTADHLLLSTSLFTDSPYVENDGRRDYATTARDRIGRGKAYYHYAAMYQERLPAVSSAVARVLVLLSQDFERYVDVLFHMRGEYFNLYERISKEQIMSLQEDLSRITSETDTAVALRALRDEFLDAYWAWHQSPDEVTRQGLDSAVRRLQEADPAFRFQLPT